MEQFGNFWGEPPQDGYQMPPNVVMNGAGIQAPAPAAPAPQTRIPAMPQRPIAPAAYKLPPYPAPNRPWWFPLAMVGIPSGAVLLLGMMAIVMSNSSNSVTKDLAATNSAAVMEGMKNRTNVTLTCGITCYGLDTASLGSAILGQEKPAPAAAAPAPEHYARAIALDGAGLNIYSQSGAVINTIPAGDKLKVLQIAGEWTLVEWIGAGGFQGWVKTTGVQN